MKSIVLAGGCFWGMEEYYSRVPGILSTKVGYANGMKENPSYEEVCTGKTGHAEAVLLEYDEKIIDLEEILRRFWTIINPTSYNRQGNDIASQYRSGIYYFNEDELETIQQSRDEIAKKYTKPIATEVGPLNSFYDAEEYHQKYLKKNPGGYCHIDLSNM
ncbi:MAG: peptide-methionine (S)-S-oxide reductase MsrA [Eubacteriaceae bacterium]|nr:peptide-methionine (S)-S-oxide reductase MsrA [Eubacteriaceae bacterium]